MGTGSDGEKRIGGSGAAAPGHQRSSIELIRSGAAGSFECFRDFRNELDDAVIVLVADFDHRVAGLGRAGKQRARRRIDGYFLDA